MRTMTKPCTKCGEVKELSDYRKRADSKDGHSHICKKCLSIDGYRYRKDPEVKKRLKKLGKEYYKKNKKVLLKKMQDYYINNKESCNKNSYKYAKRNKHKKNMLKMSRLRATPKWLTKDQKKEILSFYAESQLKKETTGIDYNVDHIVPLNGKNVCGLHVPWNLRVIEASKNKRKSNKLIIEEL